MFPTFAIPKKNGKIRVVSNFRKKSLTLILKCHPFPIPKIEHRGMIRSMEKFTFALELDLNMGYCHIKLHADAQNLYKISCIHMVIGKIQIQTLTHGYQDCLHPDVFQNVMSTLVQDMKYVETTILS
jgi:hypothetical protein